MQTPSQDNERSTQSAPITMTGAQAILHALVREGVDTIFGYPGGAIMPTYDALYDFQDKIRHVLVRHEQGASHAAEGYARVTGKVGVCIATSGPGATNLVTGIADAMLDSIPLVCITGQVGKMFLGTDAFQETDVIGITMPITKWSYQITSPEEIPAIMAKAFDIALNGRPGPVVVDITKNAQVESFDYHPERDLPVRFIAPRISPSQESLARASELINTARRPLLLVGHGVLIAKAQHETLAFIEKTGIPVASTLLGLSAIPSGHPLYVGMLGMHGNYGPNLLTNSADLIIGLGMRFDDRVTGKLSQYAQGARIIHIDIDAAELGKNLRTEVAICADAKETLRELLPRVTQRTLPDWREEFSKCDALEFEKVIKKDLYPESGPLKMSEVVRLISEATAGEAIVVADVGQHQMSTARYYKFQKPDSFVTSGGLGTMGFALPAGLGTAIGAPHRTTIVIVGDGGFQMTLQELATIAQENTPVKVVILNNNFLGMVRQWQELFFERRYSFTEMKNPNFVMISQGFGVPAERVAQREEIAGALNRMLTTPGPYLLEIMVEKESNVFPMVPAGASVSEVRLE
jgi:acetolactate synthase-1/2/3 large subunit